MSSEIESMPRPSVPLGASIYLGASVYLSSSIHLNPSKSPQELLERLEYIFVLPTLALYIFPSPPKAYSLTDTRLYNKVLLAEL